MCVEIFSLSIFLFIHVVNIYSEYSYYAGLRFVLSVVSVSVIQDVEYMYTSSMIHLVYEVSMYAYAP